MAWNLSAFADEAGPSCEDQIAGLKQAGLKFIDIRGIDGHNITVLPVDHAKQVREKLDKAGIRCAMFGSPIGKIDIADDVKIDIEKLTHLGALKTVLGCDAVRMFSYYNKGGKDHATFRKEALSRLKELAKVAGDVGLVLYHENESHIFGDKCEDVLAISQELRGDGKGAFRMIFDFGNYNAGGEDVWANWLKLRDLTDAIHLKDNVRNAEGKMHHTPAGQGNGKIPEILADATKRGWSGPMTVEPHLQHSAAVAATGPSGVANQAYSSMTANECFQVACRAAKDVIAKAGGVAA